MRTILFIHGFATSPAIWKGQIDEFSKDFEVFTEIDKVDKSTELFVVGWSMGGWKALELWEEKRFKIKGLVLVSAFAKYAKNEDYPSGASLALIKKLEKKFMADYRKGLHYFYDLIFKDKNQLAMITKVPVPDKDRIVGWFEKLRNEDKREMLSRIDVPVLIIQGDEDPIVTLDTAKFMKGEIKHSKLEVFKGGGHAPFLEEADRFNRCLRGFISKNENR